MTTEIAFFDFDGTITTHDSYREFLVFIFGKKQFIRKIFPVIPWLIGFLLKLVTNEKVKMKITERYFTGMSCTEFEKHAISFVDKVLPQMIRTKAYEKIQWHISQKHQVVVVSASFEDYLKFWCKKHNIALIGTKLASNNNILNGKFATANCWGKEKVRRIKELYNLKDYSHIYAYGDSRGDKEMLALANSKEFKPFCN